MLALVVVVVVVVIVECSSSSSRGSPRVVHISRALPRFIGAQNFRYTGTVKSLA